MKRFPGLFALLSVLHISTPFNLKRHFCPTNYSASIPKPKGSKGSLKGVTGYVR